jgi:two-component system chemotaxis response regulator CheY
MAKVLLVEDSAAMRSLVSSMIAALRDYEVREAKSGSEAISLLSRERFDLIVTDIHLPDLSGLELIRFVRQSQEHQNTPLFIISTEGGVRDRERGFALGANEYLAKPFDPQELQQLVRRYVG